MFYIKLFMNDYLQAGQQAIQNRNITRAIDCFEKAVKVAPRDAQAHACLGQALCWDGQQEKGFAFLRKSGQLLFKKAKKNRDVRSLLNLAEQLQHWNDYPGSLELCKQAVKIDSRVVKAYQLMALAYMRLNKKKPALSAAKQALDKAPDSAMLMILVATLEINAGQLEKALIKLERVLSRPLISTEEKFRAHKEAARALDKSRQYAQVFRHLHAAGEVAPQLPEVKKLDAGLVPGFLQKYKTEFTRDVFLQRQGALFDDAAPVFVLGFMRTGTTLTQEVLAAHGDVFVADESDLLSSAVKVLKDRVQWDSRQTVTENLASLTADDIRELRSFYWQKARNLFGDVFNNKVFVDKTTMNCIDIGFINVIFPDARMIFLVRDPRDVCLSCMMQTMIPTPSTMHLNAWQDCARFYAQVMEWWLQVQPRLTLPAMELKYEDAVFDFQATYSRVFEFIGLEWEESVSSFHKKAAGKVIASPSYDQVSQPLYSSSVGRWKHYAEEYEAVEAFLGPYIKHYQYD